MKNKASVVIIGGGIVGCSTAFNLAKRGMKDIVLIERRFLASGATGRCGAGIRQQWGTYQNCLLARESMRIFEHFKEVLETDIDIELKQKGYLLLAYSEKEMEQFRKNVEIQHLLGIPSRIITSEEARTIVPFLNTDKMTGGAFCGTDGHANPFLATKAYAEAAERLGVTIYTDTEVKGITVENERIKGVQTHRGYIETEKVVNAAGGWSGKVGEMAGIQLPVYPERHEILVTEPVNPILDPMVMSFSYNIYCQQTPHGSFIMGYGPKDEPRSYNMKASWQFLETMVQKAAWLLPPLKNIRIVRQWAGLYNMSVDRQPIVCESETIKGFYMGIGFSGHGFMIAPAVGTLLADIITGSPLSWDVILDLGRFERNEIIAEPSVV
jgi:sarcosine oxidase subunit beta